MKIIFLVFCILLILIINIYCIPNKPNEANKEFNTKYKRYINNTSDKKTFSSRIYCDSYNEIVRMGIVALPDLMKLLEQKQEEFVTAVNLITHKKFYRENDQIEDIEKCVLYCQWWKKGRKDTSQNLETALKKVYDLNLQNRIKIITYRKYFKMSMLDLTLREIEWIGIDIIPYLIEIYSTGNTDFNNIIRNLTNLLFDCKTSPENAREWWLTNRNKFTIEDEDILKVKVNRNDFQKAKKWIHFLESDQMIYYQNAEIGLEDLPETEEIMNYLFSQLQNNKNGQVRKSIALTLGRRKFKDTKLRFKTKKSLIERLDDSDGEVRAEVVFALGEMGDKDIIPLFKKKYESDKYSKEIDSFDGKEYKKKKIFPVKREIKRLFERWGEKVPE